MIQAPGAARHGRAGGRSKARRKASPRPVALGRCRAARGKSFLPSEPPIANQGPLGPEALDRGHAVKPTPAPAPDPKSKQRCRNTPCFARFLGGIERAVGILDERLRRYALGGYHRGSADAHADKAMAAPLVRIAAARTPLRIVSAIIMAPSPLVFGNNTANSSPP